jgi:hypothetical protein
MRKWYQRSRKRDGWVERKRRFRKMFAAFPQKIREVAVVQQVPNLGVEEVPTK